MTDRREFLTLVGALGAGVARPGPGDRAVRGALTVTAQATVFHAHPGGRASLVRFTVTETDQSAGRLRVFDRRGTLVGTAGVLRAGDRLVGELWLPLDGETRFRSELEMPGTRAPVRTSHALRPRPRWTIYCVTLADPDALIARLLTVPPILRGAEVARLARAGVRGDPIPHVPDPRLLDHLALLHLPAAAVELDTRFVLPMATAAREAAVAAVPNAAVALAGSGIGGTVVAAATPDALGFDRGRVEVTRRIEAWLATLAPAGGGAPAHATVVGTDLGAVDRLRATVDDWNASFAYPRIIVGLDEGATRPAGDVEYVAVPAGEPTARDLAHLRDARAALVQQRFAETFVPLGTVIGAHDPTPTGIAAAAALPASGVLAFNPAPFTRSGPLDIGGYATSVPALGYAWLTGPRGIPGHNAARPGVTTVANTAFSIELDEDTGAVRSLRDATGREWAHALGLNVVEGARLDLAVAHRVAGGAALTARRVTLRGAITSTVTLYDDAEHVELVNESSAVGTDPIACLFQFAHRAARARWEVPGGVRSADLPVRPTALLRWLALDGPDGAVMLAAPDTPAATIDASGAVTLAAGDGASRVLIQPATFPSEVEPWRLAAHTVPLVGVTAPGTGPVRIPTFGRPIAVDEPGVLVAGLRTARDGVGVIAYLQEVLGLEREVPLQGELLRFEAALACDLVERDRATLPLSGDSLVLVPLARYGFSAVRLLGLSLGR